MSEIDAFLAVFSTFDMTQVVKICKHCWEESFKNDKINKFDSDLASKKYEDTAMQSCKIL